MLQASIGPGLVINAIMAADFFNVQDDFDLARFTRLDSDGYINYVTVTTELVQNAPPPTALPDSKEAGLACMEHLPPVLAALAQSLLQLKCRVQFHQPEQRSDQCLATLERIDYIQSVNRLVVHRVKIHFHRRDGRYPVSA